MTTYYCNELSGIASSPQTQAWGYYQGAQVKSFQSTITMASQLSGSIFVLAQPQAGLVFSHLRILVSATLGSTTLAISDSVSTNEYFAAATVTTSVAPLPTTAQLAYGPLTAQGQLICTTAAATLPSSGTIVIETFWLSAN